MTSRRGSAFMLFLIIYFITFFLVISLIVFPLLNHLLYDHGFVTAEVISSPWFLIFQQIMTLLVPLGIWLLIHKEKLSVHLPNMKLGSVNILIIVFLSIFIQPAMMLISGISGLFFPNEIAGLVGGMAVHPYWLLLLAVAVTPAICEEIVFRGYLQSAYSDRPFKKAALLNGLFFAIIHLNAQQFLYAFAMGVIFAYVVHYTRSIRAGILSHFIINGSQVSLMRLASWLEGFALEIGELAGVDTTEIATQAEMIAYTGVTFEMQIQAIASIGIIALFTTPCAAIIFRTFISHNRQRNMQYDMRQLFGKKSVETETADNETVSEIQIPEIEVPATALSDDTPPFTPYRPRPKYDPFAIAVVVIFIVFLLLFQT